MARHLWDEEFQSDFGDYNYYDTKVLRDYNSWEEFLEEWAHADNSMNYVVNWDWKPNQYDDETGDPVWSNNPAFRDGILRILVIGQRKGLYHVKRVQVCKSDEPDIRKYLEKKYEYVKQVWQPFS